MEIPDLLVFWQEICALQSVFHFWNQKLGERELLRGNPASFHGIGIRHNSDWLAGRFRNRWLDLRSFSAGQLCFPLRENRIRWSAFGDEVGKLLFRGWYFCRSFCSRCRTSLCSSDSSCPRIWGMAFCGNKISPMAGSLPDCNAAGPYSAMRNGMPRSREPLHYGHIGRYCFQGNRKFIVWNKSRKIIKQKNIFAEKTGYFFIVFQEYNVEEFVSIHKTLPGSPPYRVGRVFLIL